MHVWALPMNNPRHDDLFNVTEDAFPALRLEGSAFRKEGSHVSGLYFGVYAPLPHGTQVLADVVYELLPSVVLSAATLGLSISQPLVL